MKIAALLLALALSGCGHAPSSPAAAPPTPIAQLNGAAMSVPRIDFCSLVPAIAVTHALDTSSWTEAGYGNGNRTKVTTKRADVVAEHGCAWQAKTGSAQARAWVFARPVDRAFGELAVRDERRQPGCRLTRGPGFGSPTLSQRCELAGVTRIRRAGLFGSSWLTCEVTDVAPKRQLSNRADAWCVEIANALNTNR